MREPAAHQSVIGV